MDIFSPRHPFCWTSSFKTTYSCLVYNAFFPLETGCLTDLSVCEASAHPTSLEGHKHKIKKKKRKLNTSSHSHIPKQPPLPPPQQDMTYLDGTKLSQAIISLVTSCGLPSLLFRVLWRSNVLALPSNLSASNFDPLSWDFWHLANAGIAPSYLQVLNWILSPGSLQQKLGLGLSPMK